MYPLGSLCTIWLALTPVDAVMVAELAWLVIDPALPVIAILQVPLATPLIILAATVVVAER